jgi:hypothetical protein
MDILHATVLILLCMIILFNIKLPAFLRSLGNVPLTIGLLGMCYYLFTKSPLLGIIGLVAAYEVMQTKQLHTIQVHEEPIYAETHFGETLEEQVVNNITPMAQTPTPVHLNFKYNSDGTHNAASCSG